MQDDLDTTLRTIGHAPRKVRPWTAVLFAVEVLVVVALVVFSWVSGSWS